MNIHALKVRAAGLSRKAAIASTLIAVSGSALAEGGGEDAVFTALTAKITALEGLAWPILATILVAFIGMKLVKKFANKST